MIHPCFSNCLRVCAGLALLFSISIGCGRSETKYLSGPATPRNPPSTIEPGKPEAKDPELRTVDIDGYNAEIAAHKGKVVLVDFWATWCGPCTKQFSHTVKLHETYASRGLDVVSMSFDDEGDEPAVRAFLKEQQAHFVNLRSEYGAGVESSEKHNLNAGVPHYRLYDKTGKQRESWDGEPDGVQRKIEELLKEQP